MRSLPEASREEPLSVTGNCYGGSCHNWLYCLLGGLGQSGLSCSGFNSPRREVRCGWLNQQLIITPPMSALPPKSRTCAVQLGMSAFAKSGHRVRWFQRPPTQGGLNQLASPHSLTSADDAVENTF